MSVPFGKYGTERAREVDRWSFEHPSVGPFRVRPGPGVVGGGVGVSGGWGGTDLSSSTSSSANGKVPSSSGKRPRSEAIYWTRERRRCCRLTLGVPPLYCS